MMYLNNSCVLTKRDEHEGGKKIEGRRLSSMLLVSIKEDNMSILDLKISLEIYGDGIV